MKPLGEMGASISARDGRFPPLEIRGAKLQPIDYTLAGTERAGEDAASYFAGLYADGDDDGARASALARSHRNCVCANSARRFAWNGA